MEVLGVRGAERMGRQEVPADQLAVDRQVKEAVLPFDHRVWAQAKLWRQQLLYALQERQHTLHIDGEMASNLGRP